METKATIITMCPAIIGHLQIYKHILMEKLKYDCTCYFKPSFITSDFSSMNNFHRQMKSQRIQKKYPTKALSCYNFDKDHHQFKATDICHRTSCTPMPLINNLINK